MIDHRAIAQNSTTPAERSIQQANTMHSLNNQLSTFEKGGRRLRYREAATLRKQADNLDSDHRLLMYSQIQDLRRWRLWHKPQRNPDNQRAVERRIFQLLTRGLQCYQHAAMEEQKAWKLVQQLPYCYNTGTNLPAIYNKLISGWQLLESITGSDSKPQRDSYARQQQQAVQEMQQFVTEQITAAIAEK